MKEILNLVQFSTRTLSLLENTEAFKSFEGTESFLKLLMKYNCAEPIGLKILLCFGHFKQLFDSKLHL